MAITKLQTDNTQINQIQNNIVNALNPVLKNPLLSGAILKQINLKMGSNSVNHGLGQTLSGWFIIRQRAGVNVYDGQDSNPNPDKTLILNSSSNVSVDLFVF